ncbi:MAG: UDP-N-acetylmuramoyl-tripeptide--D-alanyl-D-alanine ligase, partial [Bacteroidales bacterium]
MLEKLYEHFIQNPTVTTDSRNVPLGSIFFALKGDNFDGNKFAKSAIDSGASLAVIDNPEYLSEGCLLVDDALKVLQNLANYHRRKLGINIIGITGSNGKTTTKELLAAVLSMKYNVYATKGNLNNHIGVPLTLLSLSSVNDMAIVEMGANHPGDIKELAEIAEPNFGLITNIGKAHLGGFGSFEGVINTKSELYGFI